MDNNVKYQTFKPHPYLEPLIKCYWTLEVPAQEDYQKQLILPDGCLEMIFILGDNVKRYTSEDQFIMQPREMILGQITEPFFIEPTGYVNTFAVRFYPYGFANFVSIPIRRLANKETPLGALIGEEAAEELARKIREATTAEKRIEIVEAFLLKKLQDKVVVDHIVKDTIELLFQTKGSASIDSIVNGALSRRQIERKFFEKVGISPKKLGKVIRLQAVLRMLLNQQAENLTQVAYDNAYYDQAHFNRDFKEFTGTTPREFLQDDKMLLSSILYKND
jgi:AraC-like DNA-binding protein